MVSTTELENEAALKAYKATGFEIEAFTTVFHSEIEWSRPHCRLADEIQGGAAAVNFGHSFGGENDDNLLKRIIRGISHEKQAMTLNDQSASEYAALLEIAPGLKHYGERLWGDDQAGCVSYPIEAHAQFAAIEDLSFWFRHRNAIIQTVVGHHPPSGPIIDVGVEMAPSRSR